MADASKYITIHGMYELKQGVEYSVLNKSLNPDDQTWKEYSTKVHENQFKEKEIAIDLSDSVLSGSGDSSSYMD